MITIIPGYRENTVGSFWFIHQISPAKTKTTDMAFYQRSDLLYTYQWETRNDDPRLRGEPDHSLFNRHQGWEVLYLINKFGERYQVQTVASGNNLEKMIRQHLPSDFRSQDNVRPLIYNML